MHRLAALLLSLALAFPASARPLTQGEAEASSPADTVLATAIGFISGEGMVAVSKA